MSRFSRIAAPIVLVVGHWFTSCGAGEITFAFAYDSSFLSAAGSNLEAAQADFAYVGNYLKSMIKTSGAFNITLNFDITGFSDGGDSTLGFAGSSVFGFNHSFNRSLTQHAVQLGTKTWSGSDAQAEFNFGYSWGFGGNVSSSQFDFRSVVLHEMTHAMGFSGLIGSSGTTISANPGFYAWMDQFLYGWNSSTSSYEKLVQGTPGSNLIAMGNAASAVVNTANPVQFRGPNVLTYLNNTTGQNMYTPGTFSDGSSLYHVDIDGDLMAFQVGTGPQTFGYNGLNIAILKDLGYVVVPEPGTYALSIVSVVILGVYGKSRKRSFF